MGPHDQLVINAEKWKEELWAYIDEFSPPHAQEAKDLMNGLLDAIDSFLDGSDGMDYK